MNEFFASVQEILRIQLFTVSGTPINIATVVVFMLIVGGTFLVSFLVQRAVMHFLRRRGIENKGTLAASSRLIHYLIIIGGVGIGLHNLGINLTALFAAGAVFAVAIGFAMQNILQNFVSGIILLVERTIKPGDVLEVDGRIVRVEHMSIRATIARTLDDEDIIIPNTSLVQATVKNLTLRDMSFRIRIPVGVSYGSDHEDGERDPVRDGDPANLAKPGPEAPRLHDLIRKLVGGFRGVGVDRRPLGGGPGPFRSPQLDLVGLEGSGHHHRLPPDGRPLRPAGGGEFGGIENGLGVRVYPATPGKPGVSRELHEAAGPGSSHRRTSSPSPRGSVSTHLAYFAAPRKCRDT